MIVPTEEFPPWTPFTHHVTAVLEAFCTVAVNCWVAPRATLAVEGDTLTVIAGGTVTVTEAEADLEESACETAATVTVAGVGTDAGAV